MKFLEEYGFVSEDIKEVLDNTPNKIKEVLEKEENLVRKNLEYVKNLGVATYKEIFINYPDMFLMDASNFEEQFAKYDKVELITKLNSNFKMVKFL